MLYEMISSRREEKAAGIFVVFDAWDVASGRKIEKVCDDICQFEKDIDYKSDSKFPLAAASIPDLSCI